MKQKPVRQKDGARMAHGARPTARNPDQESFSFGLGNWFAKMSGNNVAVVAVLGGSLYFTTLLLLRTTDAPVKAIIAQSDAQSKEHAVISSGVAAHREMNEREHAALLRTQERIADSLDEQVFYLSKTESERANYRIEMPDSLARKLLERGMRQGQHTQSEPPLRRR